MKISNKNIDKEEIESLLTQDACYRKLGNWPLLTSKDIYKINNVNGIATKSFLVSRFHENNTVLSKTSLEIFTFTINNAHPFTTELLVKFQGHIVACGGSVAKSLTQCFYGNEEDIDIFFYDIDVGNATKLRSEIIQFLVNKWQNTNNQKLEITVLRNEFVTTLYVIDRYKNDYSIIYSYQLIHRIYPSISSIIGGFDLNVCMVAYDGNEIYATPFGAWGIKNHTVIIDTKRRSTSFEHRLCKYYNYGFNILFPGITREIIDDLIINPCKSLTKNEGEFLDELLNLARQNGFKINDLSLSKIRCPDKLIFLDQQKKENVLPFININDGNNDFRRDEYSEYEAYDEIKIGILPYNIKNIENRHINKISDYSHNNVHLKFLPDINATRLRLDNLNSVVSILKIDNETNISSTLENDTNNPDLKFTDDEIEKFIERAEYARNFYGSEYSKSEDIYEDEYYIYKDTVRLTRCFGKLSLEVAKIRNTNEYDNYINLMIEKMKTNAKICKENLTGIKWITKNPGRQWTSSINPIISDPREWYGKHYIPVLTGIPAEIETCLRLIYLPKTESVWIMLPKDIFDLLLLYVMKAYADDAWKYI